MRMVMSRREEAPPAPSSWGTENWWLAAGNLPPIIKAHVTNFDLIAVNPRGWRRKIVVTENRICEHKIVTEKTTHLFCINNGSLTDQCSTQLLKFLSDIDFQKL